MPSRAIPGRLAYPVAVIVAAGLVSAPMNSGAAATSPRFVEFSAVRLQAEATTLIAGLTDSAAANTATALPGAAAASSATAAATAEPCDYPCTILDKFLYSLPPEIRSILLPPLITLAAVIGAVLAPFVLVSSLVFGWPYELGPAAAGEPEDPAGPAQAGDPDDSAATAMQADPGAPAAVAGAPAAVPGEPAADHAEGRSVVRGREVERTAADAPVPGTPMEAAVPGPDAAQAGEPQPGEPQTVEPVSTEPEATEPEATEPAASEPVTSKPNADAAVAIVADLPEMIGPGIPSAVAEVEATADVEATAQVDEQHDEAATNFSSRRAAERSTPQPANQAHRS